MQCVLQREMSAMRNAVHGILDAFVKRFLEDHALVMPDLPSTNHLLAAQLTGAVGLHKKSSSCETLPVSPLAILGHEMLKRPDALGELASSCKSLDRLLP